MKCFFYFRGKSRRHQQNSAPVLEEGRTSDSPKPGESARETKSSSSVTVGTGSSRSIPALFEEKAHNLRVFSFSELRNATNNFSRLHKIGEGGFGSVYRGFLPALDGEEKRTVVAIKKLNSYGLQGHKQWVAEVQCLAIVEHPNLVNLLGFCAVDGERGIQRLLVYEFMPNKSLDDHLFNRALPVLSWNTRLKIVLGAAVGLKYLHEEMEVPVIYRDFKASNVLLDKEFNPKLSDFGLAREGPMGEHTHVSTAVVGTRGYAAPDYVETGHLTIKSDVWSFGVVLYEILTGRRSLERSRPKNEQKLLDWVKQFPAKSRNFSMIMDPRLNRNCCLAAARRIAMLADRCLSKFPNNRPMMSEVVVELRQAIEVSESANKGEPTAVRSC